MVQRIGWIFTTNQQTQNDPFTPNQPRHCLKNIPFSLLQKEYIPLSRIKMSKKNAIKNWKKKTLLIQKYLKSLGEASILKAKKITLEVLRQPKTAKNEDIIPFTTIYNTSNSNVFPIINQSFNNFQYFKTMSNVFQKKKLVNSMSQAPNLGRLLCKPVGCNLSTLSLIYIYIYIYISPHEQQSGSVEVDFSINTLNTLLFAMNCCLTWLYFLAEHCLNCLVPFTIV